MKVSRPHRRRERRALLLAAFVILPSLALGRGLPAIHRWELREASRWRELTIELEKIGKAAQSHRTAVAVGAGQRSKNNVLRESILSAESIAEATGALTEYVGGIARFTGAQVTSIGVTGDSAFNAGTGRLRLELAVMTDTEGMLSILRELAVGPKQVALRAISVNQSNPGSSQDQRESMLVDLTLESVILQTGDVP